MLDFCSHLLIIIKPTMEKSSHTLTAEERKILQMTLPQQGAYDELLNAVSVTKKILFSKSEIKAHGIRFDDFGVPISIDKDKEKTKVIKFSREDEIYLADGVFILLHKDKRLCKSQMSLYVKFFSKGDTQTETPKVEK